MDTKFVWCTFADTDTFTRFDGATHFCSMCGATDHAEILPVSNPDPVRSPVYLPPDISGSMGGNDHRW